MNDIRTLNWFQRLLPRLTAFQIFLPVAAGILWMLTAIFMGDKTPTWVEPLALSVGLLIPVLIFGIDKVHPRDIDSVVEQIICNSDMVGDWYINSEYSGPDMSLSCTGALNADIGELRRVIAVYKKDPALMITLYRSEDDNKEFMEEWLKPLVIDKQHNSMHRVSITFNGSEVVQKYILLIDGGRCYFPLPKSPEPPIKSDFLSIAICQILNQKAEYSTQFYIKRAGMHVLDVDKFDSKIVSKTVN